MESFILTSLRYNYQQQPGNTATQVEKKQEGKKALRFFFFFFSAGSIRAISHTVKPINT